ncbi:phosphonopyruvate decarboxylase [Natronosporangium hydrolyticum]|uniref:Phosphonopyruvate decarboxylase n=1 Tax=Natronosporangium hydrolyticum TaxID=2811111 RepID=A0A895YBN6_9ACTN|nr:phosphonopyruvate decarboxylase [Natronosporangium hydrolyticum]QSB15224.1 phosphonopyruvate decarboxylase [Natronosporangium hydrolyticum]
MIDPARFLADLSAHGVSFYTGVPDSLLKHLNTEIMQTLPPEQHVIAANEGAAVGIALGHYLRTGAPAAVYLQNSGFGNLVNPLLSLADPAVYGVPMVLVIGWRGQPGVPDEPQHVTQGRVMTALLDAMELPWSVLPTEPGAATEAVADAVRSAVARSGPSVLLVEKNTFTAPAALPADHERVDGPTGRVDEPAHDRRVSREEALTGLVAAVGAGPVIVATTGMLSRELFELRARTGADGDTDFLTVGGMGHACSIALGVAMREPTREVWCFDGDGALLMHLGSLAVIAQQAPPRLFHVVFNNGVHDSVGGQPTAIDVVDVAAAARGLGYRHAEPVTEPGDVPAAVARMRATGGPSLLELRVRPGSRPDLGRPTRTPAQSRDAFMAALAGQR